MDKTFLKSSNNFENFYQDKNMSNDVFVLSPCFYEWLKDVVIFPHNRKTGVLKNGLNNKQTVEKI